MAAPHENVFEFVPVNLRVERNRKGWTQAELAEELGVDENTVKRHEAGKHITIKAVRKYANVFDCTCDDLMMDRAGDDYRLYQLFQRVRCLPADVRQSFIGFAEKGLEFYKV